MIFILGGGIVLVLVAVVAFVLISQSQKKSKAISERLGEVTQPTLSLEEMELQQSFLDRVIFPLWRTALAALGKMSPKNSSEKLRLQLQAAGNPGGITPTMFSGLRTGLAILLFVIFGFVTFMSMDTASAMMYTAIGAGLGYLLPGMWLGQQIKKRKHNILRSLPDSLDLLTISVEAGLGFDLAMQRVTDKWDNELSQEFQRVISDVRLGRSRREAMRDMADRTDVEDVQTFVGAIIQAEQLGVSMSKILRLQSDQLRVRRRQRAEEQAQKAPVLMLIPMVFLIFPSIFVIILGPAIPKLMGVNV
ncbi:MAG: type II secretion system F family protein [Chloroflexaceae bacterium]|nr:type II secretion system F family protein [Chloroflexaceae bacterium]